MDSKRPFEIAECQQAAKGLKSSWQDMADFSTVQVMSGGQSASVALMMKNQMSLLQYPAAAANAVVLLAVVLLMVAAILRVVDIRKEL